MSTADEFKIELHRMMLEAIKGGQEFVDINAGDLHGRVGGYPGANHRMPVCCGVMLAAFSEGAGDSIREEPPSRQGAKLTIHYVLPRIEPIE
jgi:hypothetical protein